MMPLRHTAAHNISVLVLVSEHYADDLEVDLQAAMLQDFNAELKDDSPREVCSITYAFSTHQNAGDEWCST